MLCLIEMRYNHLLDSIHSTPMQHHTQYQNHAFFSFKNIWQNKQWLCFAVIIGAILGFLSIYLFSWEYKFTASVQLGKEAKSDKSIETSASIIERFYKREDQAQILRSLNIDTKNTNPVAKLFYNTLSIYPIKESAVINIEFHAYEHSTGLAQMQKLVQAIQQPHNALYTNYIEAEKMREINLKGQLEEIKTFSKLLEKQQMSDNQNATNSVDKGNAILQLNLMQAYFARKNEIQQNLVDIEKNIKDLDNYRTKMIGAIDISVKPAFPNKMIFTILGAIFSLLITALYLYIKKQKTQMQNQSYKT